MKRSILLTVSMLSFAPSLGAASWQCVPTQGCPKDQKPPACCEPPPCQFYFQMKLTRAIRHGFSLEVQRSALASAKVDDERGHELYERNFDKDLEKQARRFAKCPAKAKGKKHGPAPILTANADQECRITIYERSAEVSLDDVKAKSRTCSEFIDAEYAEASQEQINCQANATRDTLPLETRRMQDRMQVQARLIRWSVACWATGPHAPSRRTRRWPVWSRRPASRRSKRSRRKEGPPIAPAKRTRGNSDATKK